MKDLPGDGEVLHRSSNLRRNSPLRGLLVRAFSWFASLERSLEALLDGSGEVGGGNIVPRLAFIDAKG